MLFSHTTVKHAVLLPISFKIKTLKALVWYLSRESMKEMSTLKQTNKQTVMYDEQRKEKALTISGTK